MESKTKKARTVRLGDDLEDRLAEEKERTGAPKNTIIKRALDGYLPKKSRRAKRGA